ncbi:MAG TPA: hypothetical protein VL068_10260, partial [Microthrixaceae bacterium]|nr:hypothetical protein [Microthrixaceae bacterium]
ALDLPFELIEGQPASGAGPAVIPAGFLVAEPTHPAARAFVAAGGDSEAPLFWRSPIPPGRGIGFSGAARVAGAYLALAGADGQADTSDQVPELAMAAFQIAAKLEGHPDNAAASAFGGMTVSVAATDAHQLNALGFDAVGFDTVGVAAPPGVYESLRVVVFSPGEGTSTDSSRAHLGETTSLSVATSSIGRSSMWVAAMASGRLDLLRNACRDDLHQPSRLVSRPDSARALESFLDDDEVLAAWLSGSGPSVAALVVGDDAAQRLGEQLADPDHQPGSRVRILRVDVRGVRPVIPD